MDIILAEFDLYKDKLNEFYKWRSKNKQELRISTHKRQMISSVYTSRYGKIQKNKIF